MNDFTELTKDEIESRMESLQIEIGELEQDLYLANREWEELEIALSLFVKEE